MAIGTSEYSWPASSAMNITGPNTSTVVRVEASKAAQTSDTPCSAASNRSSPCRRLRSMFSSTTMLLSRVMPMAKAIPAKEITLIVRSKACSPRKPARVHSGMPIKPTPVSETQRRKPYSTALASSAPMARLVQTLRKLSST